MNENRQYKSGRDICISVFLIAIMILRLVTENTALFALFALISFIAAVDDIYVAIEREFSCYRTRFLIVRGTFVVGAIVCTILVSWNINPLVVDELSILALLASLPKELHCYILGNFIRGSEEN